MDDLLLLFDAFKAHNIQITPTISTHPQIEPLLRELAPEIEDAQVDKIVEQLHEESLLITSLIAWIKQEHTNSGGYLNLSRDEFCSYFALAPELATKVLKSIVESGSYYWVEETDLSSGIIVERLKAAFGAQYDHVTATIATLVDTGNSPIDRKRAIRELTTSGDHRSIDSLIKIVNDGVEEIRCAAVGALAELGGPRAVDALIGALQDRAELVRRISAFALGKTGEARVVDPLLVALQDENEGVRQTATVALDNLNWAPQNSFERVAYLLAKEDWEGVEALGAGAIEALLTVLKTGKGPYIRCQAIKALEVIRDPQALSPLLAVLQDKNEETDVRESAAAALGAIGDNRVAIPLITALKVEDEDSVRKAAIAALYKLNWSPQNDCERINFFIAKKDWAGLEKLGSNAVDALIPALQDEDRNIRSWTALTLGKIGDARAVDPLINTLQEDSLEVRKWAAFALGKIGDTQAVSVLIEALQDKDADVRKAAVTALDELHWSPQDGSQKAAYSVAKEAPFCWGYWDERLPSTEIDPQLFLEHFNRERAALSQEIRAFGLACGLRKIAAEFLAFMGHSGLSINGDIFDLVWEVQPTWQLARFRDYLRATYPPPEGGTSDVVWDDGSEYEELADRFHEDVWRNLLALSDSYTWRKLYLGYLGFFPKEREDFAEEMARSTPQEQDFREFLERRSWIVEGGYYWSIHVLPVWTAFIEYMHWRKSHAMAD